MNVRVKLHWSEGDPALTVTEDAEGLTALVDPRLSEAQVKAACAQLDGAGEAVWQQWQERVGLSAEGGPAT